MTSFLNMALAGIAIAVAAPAAAATATAGGEAVSDRMMDANKAGRTRAAFEQAMPTVLATKPIEIDNVVQQTENAIRLYGPMTRWELATSEAIGTLLVKRVYVSQHAKAPLFWTVIAYNAPDGWQVTNFNFDDKVAEKF